LHTFVDRLKRAEARFFAWEKA
jgi:hypothetical protein